MIKVTAAEVNKLRKATGAGMMDCKKALVEAEGDFDKAIDNLRKKGQKVAANMSHRELHVKFWILKTKNAPENAIRWSDITSYPVPVVIERFINNFRI